MAFRGGMMASLKSNIYNEQWMGYFAFVSILIVLWHLSNIDVIAVNGPLDVSAM